MSQTMNPFVQKLLRFIPFLSKIGAKQLVAPYSEVAVETVMDILRRRAFNPALTTVHGTNGLSWVEIQWTDDTGDTCCLYPENIALAPGKVAWQQSSKQDRHLLVVYENDTPFQWVPETQNPAFGCRCLLLDWYKEHLIFVYEEKHDTCVCVVQNGQVQVFKFVGGFLNRKEDLVAYWLLDRPNGDEGVCLIRIPELVVLPPISREKALQAGLLEG
jgi:hypothetical protein